MLEIDHNLSNTVKHLFLDYQWSPDEIEGRLRLEYGKAVISYQTIYSAIYRGHFDDNSLSHRARGGIRKHHHRGKKRHTKGYVENRGKISISHLFPLQIHQIILIQFPSENNVKYRSSYSY